MRAFSTAILAIALATAAFSQPPAPSPAPKDKAAKLPPSPLDKVEGYKRQLIEGFTVMLSTASQSGEVKGAEITPLEVLALEFSTIKKVMLPKQVEQLQKIPVWVEWDDQPAMTNGRSGSAIAVYYGGTQASLLARNQNPLKAKCVTLHSLKNLTRMHQPTVPNQSIVLLHEYVHAVHDQQLTFDHAGIKTAYKQAMERKLYDKDQYISTNEAEFFAESSCAYFDQLDHYPKTRDDLKKHDPATHKLLEQIWGTAKRPKIEATKVKLLADTNGADKFDLGIKLSQIRLGRVVHGPDFKPGDAKGHVLVFANFGGDELLLLEKLARMHDELAPYGAIIVAANTYVADPAQVRKTYADRNLPYTGLDKALFPQKEPGSFQSENAGHTLVFDIQGVCVFRGSGYDALPHVRAAVVKPIVEKAFPGERPESMAKVLGLISQGSLPPWESAQKLGPYLQDENAEIAGPAKQLALALVAPAAEALAEAQGKAKSDPLTALATAEKVTTLYKGTQSAAKAAALIEQLKSNPVVAEEMRARVLLEPIRKLDTQLTALPRGFNPLDPRFQKDNAAAIKQLMDLEIQLKKKHPNSRAAAEAAKMIAKYQIES